MCTIVVEFFCEESFCYKRYDMPQPAVAWSLNIVVDRSKPGVNQNTVATRIGAAAPISSSEN